MTPTTNTPEAPQEGLVERLRYRVNNPSAWDSYDEGASELLREAAEALTPSPVQSSPRDRVRAYLDRTLPGKEAVQSSPGEVERPLLVSWFDGMAAVVGAAWCAADSSSDDFDPETCVSIPMDEMQKLSDAIDALEGLVPAGHAYVGIGALNDDVRAAFTPPSSPASADRDYHRGIHDAALALDARGHDALAGIVRSLLHKPDYLSPASAEVGEIVERLTDLARRMHERIEIEPLPTFGLHDVDIVLDAAVALASSPFPALRVAEEALEEIAGSPWHVNESAIESIQALARTALATIRAAQGDAR